MKKPILTLVKNTKQVHKSTAIAKKKHDIARAELEAVQALMSIPPPVMNALRRYFFEDLSLAEAAALSGLIRSTFAQKVNRAALEAMRFRKAIVLYEAYQHSAQINHD
jgi:predicted DNA-binding protein YlxM (UPF0122 family)